MGNKCKKLNSLIKVCNGDRTYVTQIKQKNQKCAIIFAAQSHNVIVILSNSAFLISVFVV